MRFLTEFFRDLRMPLYRNAITLMLNIALMSGLGFLFWIIVARYYTPYEVGLAAAIIPLMALIGMLSRFGLDMGLVRFLPSSDENSGAMINSCFTISGVAALLISLVFLIGLDIWSPVLFFIRENLAFSVSFIVFSVVFALYPMMNQVFVARRNTKFVFAGTLISGSRILLPIIFASFFGVFGIFVSWGMAMLIALVVGILVFVPIVNPGYRPFPTVKMSQVKDMFHFSAGNYVAGVFGAIPACLLPLVIANTFEVQNVAYYYIAFTIASLLFAIVSGICLSLFAEGSHYERELGNNVRKALKLVFALLVPAIVTVVFFGKHFLLLFGSEYSSEGLVLLQILALSSIFVALNGIFLATRQVLKRLKPIIAIPVFSAFATVGMSYAFLMSMGLVGIGIAWILNQGIVSAGIGVHLLRERGGEK